MTVVLICSQCWKIKFQEKDNVNNRFKPIRRVTSEEMQTPMCGSNTLGYMFRLSQGHLESCQGHLDSNDGKELSSLPVLPEGSE